MMKIKGTAVRIVPQYIQQFYPQLYDQWLEKLPEPTKQIFAQKIYPTNWFPLFDAAIVPINVLAQLLEQKPEDLAHKIGQFSADIALKGVYKIFVSVTSVDFLLRRAPRIVKTYYDPAQIHIEEHKERMVKLSFGKVPYNCLLIYHRIKGWIDRLVFITQKSEPVIQLELVQEDNLYTAKFIIQW